MGYQTNMNNQDKVSVSAVPFNPQTQAFSPSMGTVNLGGSLQNSAPAGATSAPINAPTTMPKVQTGVPTAEQNLAAFQATQPKYNNPNPTITADNLGVQKVNIPAAPVAQTVAQPVNQAEQILAQTAVADTEAQKASQNLSKSILSIIPNLQGQAQSLVEAQNAQRLPELRQNLQNINNQILTKTAELNQDEIKLAQSVQNIEDKPIAMEFITGQQQSVARNAQIARALKASEIGVLNATALGMQGNIALAEATAKQAVETKYAPYKELLDTYKLQLEALQPILSSDEKKQAREQTIKTNLAMNDLERRQKNEDTSNKMIIDAMAFAPQSVTAAAQKVIANGGTPVQVAQALGKYAGDFLGNQLKLSSIAENNAQIAKISADIKATQATIPNNAPVGSTNYSLTSWTNSAKNKGSLTAEERSGVSKAFSVVNQIGALNENLKKDQTSFFGGNVKKLLASIGQNADAGTVNAQITALVPQVAKGIYGEVGVLTDQDTARYTQTLPNLTSPEKQNDAVTALTLTALRNGVKSKLDVAAASNLDVSGFVPLYQDLTTKINKINDRTGVNDVRIKEIVTSNPTAAPLVQAMIKDGRTGSEILQVLGAE